VSEGKTFLYFLAITGFDWLQFTEVRLSGRSEAIRPWDWFDAGFALAITLAGLVYLFACNGGPRGTHFLQRYFPLSVVVGWKFLAASFVVLGVLRAALKDAPPELLGWSAAIALAALNLAMFLRIGHHIRVIRRQT
jgi:hypothetical protein